MNVEAKPRPQHYVDTAPFDPGLAEPTGAESEVFYMVTEFYAPGSERGIRWDDPRFGIRWPLPDPVLSPKDAAHPDYQP